ncbi:IMPACT family protein [Desulfobacter curvatus]|uniref:IMPACT family protein n=1 Tax=Desulfobacter curvatus TaxID=2290 RepID=UPI000362CE99|nr:YigZ family protein [Desulfobacter curvatus]
MNTDCEKPVFYSVGRSVADPVRQTEIKIKRSVFVCRLSYADTIEGAKEFISNVSKEYKTATHNCWAYVVGDSGQISHCSDAGEPPGTAGKPMLNTLLSHQMTCTAAVVTRYFGGVKLGVRGLIEAYALAVEETIGQAPLVRLVKTQSFQICLDYSLNDSFLNRISALKTTIAQTDYTEKVTHELAVELSDLPALESLLIQYQRQGLLDYTKITA